MSRRTQLQRLNSWFVIGGYHSIGKQYGGLSSLWAIRLYSLHVCLPYSRQVSKPTGLWQIQNCCFFEGGILPPKKETDSKTINALLSVRIFCFPSVGHLLYGYFFSAGLKDASFFESILSKNERKIVPKTAFRLNLQVSKTVAHFFVPIEE